MNILKFFKKKKVSSISEVLGPTHLDGLTVKIQTTNKLQPHEWRRKLISSSGQTKFKIKYYGEVHKEFNNLIIRTEFAPTIILAVDSSSGEEILLFDGCKHGYDALFCEEFTIEQINQRFPESKYIDPEGNEVFEIIISTLSDFEEELENDIDENGMIELINGTKIDFQIAKPNGFDTLQIWAINENGNIWEIVSEELA